MTIPELPDAEETGDGVVEDAADLAARRKREAAEREAAELKKRSQVTSSQTLLPAFMPCTCLTGLLP